MTNPSRFSTRLAHNLAGWADSAIRGDGMDPTFDETEIRSAERALEEVLESPDPTAWVTHYTEDALFVGPGSPAVQGREGLLQMARAMNPLSSVSIRASRTEGSDNLAYAYGEASWVNGRPPVTGATTNVRFVIVWRKEADGQWRVALEMLNDVQPATGGRGEAGHGHG